MPKMTSLALEPFPYNNEFFLLFVNSQMMIYVLKVYNCFQLVARTFACASHEVFATGFDNMPTFPECASLYVPKSVIS